MLKVLGKGTFGKVRFKLFFDLNERVFRCIFRYRKSRLES